MGGGGGIAGLGLPTEGAAFAPMADIAAPSTLGEDSIKLGGFGNSVSGLISANEATSELLALQGWEIANTKKTLENDSKAV
jgi:hypothetical protein